MRGRRLGTILAAALAVSFSGAPGAGAQAQTYPDRMIKIVQGFPPGGNVDVFARLLARQVESQIGQQIVVDNRAGGANGIAYEPWHWCFSA